MARPASQRNVWVIQFGIRRAWDICNHNAEKASGRSGIHGWVCAESDPVMKGLSVGRPSTTQEEVATAGCGAEVGVVEGAGVDVPVGDGGSHTAQADVDPHQPSEIELELRYHRAGACCPIVARECEYSLAGVGAVHDDGIGNTKGSDARSAWSGSSRTPGWIGRGTAAAADHYWTGIERGRSRLRIDYPELP